MKENIKIKCPHCDKDIVTDMENVTGAISAIDELEKVKQENKELRATLVRALEKNEELKKEKCNCHFKGKERDDSVNTW